MKTWRERIQEARERGRFTKEDFQCWQSPDLCLVGETVQNIFGRADSLVWVKVDNCSDQGTFQTGLAVAIMHNDFDYVEQRLDEIEDAASLVKRGLK